MTGTDSIRVAAAQFRANTLNEADQALAAIEAAIEQAAGQGVELLVLPECAYPAYLLGSVERYRASGALPSEAFLSWLARHARQHRMHIACGYVEDTGRALHNSAVLIDDQGQVVGNYRKSFLWAADIEWFQPGERTCVCPTRLGRIGLVICADTRSPELIAHTAYDGAQLIAMPTCWVNTAIARGGFENPQPEFLIAARAAEFQVPFVCANKYGLESDTIGYCGRSLITDAHGTVLSEAPGDQTTLLCAALTPGQGAARPSALWPEVLATEAQRPAQRGAALRVALCTRSPDPAFVEGLTASGPALIVSPSGGAPVPSGIQWILPSDAGRVVDLPAGRVGCVGPSASVPFEPFRLLALRGAGLLCAVGGPDQLNLLRARAVENRAFVAAVNPQAATLISPAGVVLARAANPPGSPHVADIDLGEASDKKVAPHTDVWEQRRVSAYSRRFAI